jgi:hypothetical protein
MSGVRRTKEKEERDLGAAALRPTRCGADGSEGFALTGSSSMTCSQGSMASGVSYHRRCWKGKTGDGGGAVYRRGQEVVVADKMHRKGPLLYLR